MSENFAPPSRDPADDNTLLGMLRVAMNKQLMSTDDMLPARVIAFDREKNRAQVLPLIEMISTAGERVSRAQIASVPVMQIGGGGFILNFNLKPGNLGWIKANDRDISLFLQSYAQTAPNTKRLHCFEDAVFIPDVMTGYTINEEDAENAVLQTLDGSCRVAIWADRVKITAPLVVLDTPTTEITGDVTIAGDVDLAGTLTTPEDVVAAGISLNSHTHGGVEPGAGNTGGPNP